MVSMVPVVPMVSVAYGVYVQGEVTPIDSVLTKQVQSRVKGLFE